jgi:PAS domain S-box-containing protein
MAKRTSKPRQVSPRSTEESAATQQRIAAMDMLVDAVEARDRAQRLNERLLESEERLRLALDAAQMGSWAWHITAGRAELDPRMCQLLGLPPDVRALPNMRLEPLVHDADRAAYDTAMAHATDPGGDGILDIPLRIHGPTGEMHVLHLKGRTTFFGQPRQAVIMQGVAFDVTERQREQDELRATQRRQTFLLALSDALRTLSDPLEVKRTASRMLAEHLGMDRAAYFDVTEDGYHIKCDHARGLPSMVGHHSAAAFGPQVWESIHAGRTVTNNNVAADPSLTEEQRAVYARSSIAAHIVVPLRKQNCVVAACAVTTVAPREWTAEEIALVQETAERTWTLLGKARAETSLRTSESRYSALFNSIDEGFCVCRMLFDEEGRPVDYLFLEVNPLFERMTGLADAVGHTAYELVPDLEPIWLQTYARSVLHGEGFRFEQRSDAMDRWFDVFCMPVKPAGHFALVFKDISAQRKAHDELQASESFNRSLMDASPDCVEVLDTEGNLQLMNPPGIALMEIEDLTPYKGRHWCHLWPEEAHDDVRHAIARACQGEESAFDVFCPTAKGTPKWWEVRVLPVRDRSDGPVMRILSLSRDITDERQRELDLRESEGRLRMATDAGRVGVWDWNIPEDAMTWSAMLFEMFQLEPARFGGRMDDFLAMIHPEDREGLHTAIENSIHAGTSIDAEFRASRSDGGVIWLHTRAQVMRDQRGRPHRMIGATVNITRSKEAEETLKRSAQRKDEFLATLAHELRNPLAPLRNGLDLLGTASDDPHMVREVSVMMVRQVDHLVHLVSDLLDLSRISRGVIALRRSPMDLNDALQRAIEANLPMLTAKDHQLVVQRTEGPLMVYADLTRLTQIIGNLLDNAGKYMEPGGVVRLRTAAENGRAVLVISDNGIGLTPEQIPKVFEMFSQVDRGSDHSRDGLGIGLHIVKRLVEMHQGSVVVASDGPNTGCTFTVHLPLSTDAVPSHAHSDAPTTARLRILLADDNVDAAMMLSMVLRKAGHEVLAFHSGIELLQAGDSFAPDVVILDIGMPGMDGHETCRQLRGLPWGRSIPTIALTGWGQAEDRARSKQAGFDHHLIKPVDRAALNDVLSTVKPNLPH